MFARFVMAGVLLGLVASSATADEEPPVDVVAIQRELGELKGVLLQLIERVERLERRLAHARAPEKGRLLYFPKKDGTLIGWPLTLEEVEEAWKADEERAKTELRTHYETYRGKKVLVINWLYEDFIPVSHRIRNELIPRR